VNLAASQDGPEQVRKIITAIACALLSVESFADSDLRLVPTPLEEFASRAYVDVKHEREIERFTHEESIVTISAVLLESEGPLAMRMRGLRIDLASQRDADQVHLDAEDTLKVLSDIIRLQNESRELLRDPEELEAIRGTMGTGSYWCFRPRPVEHMLCPEVYRVGDTFGVSLRTMSVTGTHLVVRFPSLKLGEVAGAILKAWLYLFDPRICASNECKNFDEQ
jgi:hypothetical protein